MMIFKPTIKISIDDLSTEQLKSYYGMKLIKGHEAERVYFYLCWDGIAVRVCLDDNGYCYFVVPQNGAFPFAIFDALTHHFSCGLERVIDDRGRLVPSQTDTGAVIDWLGEDYLEPGDRILCCINGSATDPEPASALYTQVEIGRELVTQNPQLLADPKKLLFLVDDLYEQRTPPFTVTLRSKNVEVARLYAEAIQAWANETKHQSKPNTSDCPQEEVQS